MPKTIGGLVTPIGADISGLLKGTQAATRAVERYAAKTEARLRKVGDSFQRLGRSMSLKVTAPIALVGGVMLKTAASFETGMNKVQALTNATGAEFAQLEMQAKELGRTTQFSARQAAEGMGFLAMAGFETTEVLGAMPSVLTLAASAQMDLARAADITTNILTGYRMEVGDLAHANDVLVKAFTSANVDLNMLGESFKYAGPVAKAAGMEFEETATILAALGNAGIQGSMAGTTLRQALVKLQKVSPAGQKAIEDLGITITDVTTGKMRPFIDILEDASKAHSNFATEVEYNAAIFELFGIRAGPGMQALLGQGIGSLQDLIQKLRDSGGTAKRVAEVQLRGLGGAFIQLKSAVEGFSLAITDSGIKEFATGLINKLTEVFRKLATVNPEILRMGTIIAIAAASIGPLLIAFGAFIKLVGFAIGSLGTLATVFGLVLSPIGLVVASIATLAIWLVKAKGPVKALAMVWEVLQTAWEWWLAAFNKGVNWLKKKTGDLKILATITDVIGKAWIGLKATFYAVLSGIGKYLEYFWSGISNVIKGVIWLAQNMGIKLPEGFKKAADGLDGLSNKFAEFADDNADKAWDAVSNWDNAWDSMKESAVGAFNVAKTSIISLLDALEVESQDKVDKIKELLGGIGAAVGSVNAAGATPALPEVASDPMAGSLDDIWDPTDMLEKLEPAKTAFDQWAEGMQLTASDMNQFIGNTMTNLTDGISGTMANVLTQGGNFKEGMSKVWKGMVGQIIQQMTRWAIAEAVFGRKKQAEQAAQMATTVSAKTTETVANAAAAAPHPFLVPVFIAIAVGALMAALGSAGGGGGGGGGRGGSASMPTVPASAKEELGPIYNVTFASEGTEPIVLEEMLKLSIGEQEIEAVINVVPPIPEKVLVDPPIPDEIATQALRAPEIPPIEVGAIPVPEIPIPEIPPVDVNMPIFEIPEIPLPTLGVPEINPMTMDIDLAQVEAPVSVMLENVISDMGKRQEEAGLEQREAPVIEISLPEGDQTLSSEQRFEEIVQVVDEYVVATDGNFPSFRMEKEDK